MQPRYNDRPSDISNQSRARQLLGSDTLPDLAQAIGNFIHDTGAIFVFIGCFGDFVQAATRIFVSLTTGGTITEALWDESFNRTVEAHRGLVSFPFSDTPLEYRRELARTNVRSTLKLLAMDTLALVMPGPDQMTPNYLPWCMFKKFVNGVMQVANAHGPECISVARQTLAFYELYHFLEPDAHPIPFWTWDSYVVGNESDDEVDPDDLADVCFEPKGPELRVEHHAKAVTIAFELPEESCSICYEALNAYERV
jgi:hypothetical protein